MINVCKILQLQLKIMNYEQTLNMTILLLPRILLHRNNLILSMLFILHKVMKLQLLMKKNYTAICRIKEQSS